MVADSLEQRTQLGKAERLQGLDGNVERAVTTEFFECIEDAVSVHAQDASQTQFRRMTGHDSISRPSTGDSLAA